MHNCVCVPLLQRKKSYLHGFDGRALLPGFSTVEIWNATLLIHGFQKEIHALLSVFSKMAGCLSTTHSCLGWIAITLLSKKHAPQPDGRRIKFPCHQFLSGFCSGFLGAGGSENLSRKSSPLNHVYSLLPSVIKYL